MQSVNMNDILKDLQVAVDATGFERGKNTSYKLK